TLKAPIPDIDDEPRQAVRDRVKARELLAERHLLEALEALASEAPTGPSRPLVEALVATARVWAQVTPRPALIRLADALPA
ncbi:MAG: TIGR02444 family protein, partial [Brevundimonas sp.]